MRNRDAISGFALAVLAATLLVVPQSALATEYVVDQHHPGARDINAGLRDSPFKTIGQGVATARRGGAAGWSVRRRHGKK